MCVCRIVGLCLLQNEMCPLFLSRHVLKHLLGRRVNWTDLAFYDPVLFESLRQLIDDAEASRDAAAMFTSLDLTYAIEIPPEEGGGQAELVPNGSMIEVDAGNVYDYVRRYAEYRMVKHPEKCLQVRR